MDNYFVYHLHSDYSSCTTNIDSVTKIDMYIQRAKELNMNALAFSEHGNIFNWYEKKTKIEAAGMKYVHAVEAYLTYSLDDKIRDNYHCVLIARNYDGFKELNNLITKSNNRKDGHFYYTPRITFEELFSTSDNIIITSACLASVLNRAPDNIKEEYINFLKKNNHRCFLEIQHHNIEQQIQYNQRLYKLHSDTGIRLITGTDTHSLNEELAKARVIEQRAHKTFFSDEEGWDLTFKTYEELVMSYKKQRSLPLDIILDAINNTNVLEQMIEPFVVDTSFKYPILYENSTEVFRDTVYDALEKHPYALKNHSREELVQRIEEEIDVYVKTKTIDFMLFKKMEVEWMHENGIYAGPARGSVSGSLIAYLLGITDMDSLRFGLEMFRFLNKERVSQADIDTDLYSNDRDVVRNFLLTHNKIYSAEIATFNTIAVKGAIRDVGRALDISLDEVGKICNSLLLDERKDFYAPDDLKQKHPELFKWVDLLTGVIVSMGTHPAAVLCATQNIEEEIGLCSLSTTEHLVSSLDKYGAEACGWTKEDLLGLDNVQLINGTCILAGIDRLIPDNTNLDDKKVWDSIREDTTAIFQMESSLASQTIKRILSDKVVTKIKKEFPKITTFKIFSFLNILLRPCGASIRDKAMEGISGKTNIQEIDDLLAGELSYCIAQEDIMKFSMQFCGFSLGESDKLRKAITRKDFEKLEVILNKLRVGFYKTAEERWELSEKEAEKVLSPIIQCMYDASRYAFSWNHSDAYSFIGYACGYLRYYYPLEFIAVCLNVYESDEEKTAKIIKYANSKKISIYPPRFRYSKESYYMDKDNNAIYKGIKSIKYMNNIIAQELYELRNKCYNNFSELLFELRNTSLNTRQREILIKMDYFEEFGKAKDLIFITNIFSNIFKEGKSVQIPKKNIENDKTLYEIIKSHSKETEKQFKDFNILDIMNDVERVTKEQDLLDYPISLKAKFQLEYQGYVSFKTDKPEDRNKLFIIEANPLKTKDKTRVWAYFIKAISLGTGKIAEVLVYKKVFDIVPVKVGNIIKVHIDGLVKKEYNGRVSWYMNKYTIIE